jgi:transposase
MATLTRAEDRLSLTWKVWDRELIFDFIIPPFILKRDVVKWSLPTVSANGFNYSYQETPATNAGYNTAGVDLGRAVLFTMAVTGTNNTYVKHVPSPRLASLNLKRERLLKEKKSTLTKLNAYKTLNMETVILGLQVKRLTGKARQIGVELTAKSAREITNLALKNKVKILHIENLKWATGSKYGSKWNHGAQQEALTHQLTRTGIRVKTVNPRNTSQMCHKCGEKVTHNTRTRVATCPSCKQKLDRDFNAAVNILKDVNFKLSQPVSNMRTNGGNPTITEVTGNLNPKPILPNTSKR